MNPIIECNDERDMTIGASRNNSACYNGRTRARAHARHVHFLNMNLPGSLRIILKSSGCTSHEKQFLRDFSRRAKRSLAVAKFVRSPEFSDSIGRASELLLQVTPVNQVPEAVTTHGIRGQNTRGQIYRLYGRLVSCSAPPSAPSRLPLPAAFHDPRRIPSCLLGMHAASTYTRCSARV